MKIAIAVICGALVGFFAGQCVSPHRYTVQVLSQARALKTDTKTGKTWWFNLSDKTWTPIPDTQITTPMPDAHMTLHTNIPDLLDRLATSAPPKLTTTNPFSDLIPQHPLSN